MANLTRRRFIQTVGAGAAGLGLSGWLRGAAVAAATGGKPNFIVIYMDDMGYADIAPFGSKKNRTPNLDRMAAEGTRFTSFYAAPLCTASRTTLMTGCYAKRCGMPAVLFPVAGIGLSRRESPMAATGNSTAGMLHRFA